MLYFVSRQSYWGEDPADVVEIAVGGRDYANPDMLVEKYRRYGEGDEFDDPRDAVEAAIKIAEAWSSDAGEVRPIAYGCTAGFTLPFSPSGYEEARAWAERTYEKLPKCPRCGDLLPEARECYSHDFADGEFFCSEDCAERDFYDRFEDEAEEEGR